MPHALASSEGIAPVEAYDVALRDLLDTAGIIREDGGVEPPLKPSDFGVKLEELQGLSSNVAASTEGEGSAAIETSLRRIFYDILGDSSIDEPSFGTVWSLLDITTILSDKELCESNLAFWLVEELLESQTLDGCRTIFDYLESRREAMVAKDYKKKYLTVLRACNDLLKRLSRAEDTVFCGRVFIYLFSTLTFGDRSSVNLRGEFHVANTTTFDQTVVKSTEASSQMDLDPKSTLESEDGSKPATTITITEPANEGSTQADTVEPKANKAEKILGSDRTLDFDTLYPIFWTLQEYFCKPNSLFEAQNLEAFKSGLEATMAKFKQVQKDSDAGSSSAHGDEAKQSLKRKWQGDDESSKAAFNPKYLTSRDLFELEISDLAFRRHVLVQSLILIDFLLSQTPKAKAKLENLRNKSVIYSFALDEEQAKWAEKMRGDIAAYLKQGVEGQFYFRMVDTVLSRDKNWVYWKAESCPLFSRSPVPPKEYIDARSGAKRATAIKRPKNNPLGALDLRFLSDLGTTGGLDKFKDPERYRLPAMDSYRKQIENDTLDLEMASSEAEKEQLLGGRASKTWRTLRIASRSKFSVFDKIDDGNKLNVLFTNLEDERDPDQTETEEDSAQRTEADEDPSNVMDMGDGSSGRQGENAETSMFPRSAENSAEEAETTMDIEQVNQGMGGSTSEAEAITSMVGEAAEEREYPESEIQATT